MNTLMYEHPLTKEHLRIVQEVVGYTVVGPIGKKLACGDVGMGAMTEWRDIVGLVVEKFGLVKKAGEGEGKGEQTVLPDNPKVEVS